MASSDLAPRVRFRFYLLPTLLLISAALCLAAVAAGYLVSRVEGMTRDSARTLFSQIVGRHAQALQSLTEGGQNTLRVLAAQQVNAERLRANGGRDEELIRVLSRVVLNQPSLYGVYFGLDDNSFLQVIGVREDARMLASWGLPVETYFAVRYIDGGRTAGRLERWHYLSRDGMEVGVRERPTAYRPRERLWFDLDPRSGDTLLTEPYLFESSGAPGLTFSHRLANGAGMVGIDVSLGQLDQFMADTFGGLEGGAVITDQAGRVLARYLSRGFSVSPPALLERRRSATDPYAAITPTGDPAGGSEVLMAAGEPHVYAWQQLSIVPGSDFHLSAFAPMRMFTASLDRIRYELLLVSLALLGVTLLVAYWGARRLRRSLSQLTAVAERARVMDFSAEVGGRSLIYEVDSLSDALRTMQSGLQQRTTALTDAMLRLEALVQHGLTVSASQDVWRVARQAVASARSISQADACLLCLADADDRWLLLGDEDPLPDAAGVRRADALPFDEAAQQAMREQRSRVLDAASAGMVPVLNAWLPPPVGMRPGSVLLVPLAHRRRHVLGVLVLVKWHPEAASVQAEPWDPSVISYMELLAIQSAMALANLGWPEGAGGVESAALPPG